MTAQHRGVSLRGRLSAPIARLLSGSVRAVPSYWRRGMMGRYEGALFEGGYPAHTGARSRPGLVRAVPLPCWRRGMTGRYEGFLSGSGWGSRRRFAGRRMVTARYTGIFSLRSVFLRVLRVRGAVLSGLVRVMSFCRRRVVMGRCGGFLSGFGRPARSGTSSCGRRMVTACYEGGSLRGRRFAGIGARSGRGWFGILPSSFDKVWHEQLQHDNRHLYDAVLSTGAAGFLVGRARQRKD